MLVKQMQGPYLQNRMGLRTGILAAPTNDFFLILKISFTIGQLHLKHAVTIH